MLVGCLMAALTALSIIDLEQRLLPNRLVWPFVGCIWLAVFFLAIWHGAWVRLAVAVLITVLYTLAFFGLWTRGHLGAGDVKLLAGVLLVPAWLSLGAALVWVVASWLPVAIVGTVKPRGVTGSKPFAQAPFYAAGLLVSVAYTTMGGF